MGCDEVGEVPAELGVASRITPAHAVIVFDPSNYAQNVLHAARALQQITNQITSLQQSVQRTRQLPAQAQNGACDVREINRLFQQKYGNASMSTSDRDLVSDAHSRWQNTVGGLQDAMRVSGLVPRRLDGTPPSERLACRTSRWTAILTIVVQSPRAAEKLRANPLGIYASAISWSKELGHSVLRRASLHAG